jgi:diguanylate cyclase (GGDEF)-like protein
VIRAFFAAAVLTLAAPLHVAPDTQLDLWQQADAIRDDAGKLSLSDVRAAAAPWQPSREFATEHSARRYRPSITWFRLRVDAPPGVRPQVIVSWHALDAELFVPRDDGSVTTLRSGGDVPTRSKPLFSGQNAIPIPIDALDGRPIYLRVKSAYNHNSIFLLMGERAWLRMRLGWDGNQRPQLFFAGFVAAFGVLNLLFAFRLRRRAYAYYAVAVLAAALQVAVLTGDAWLYLWPDLPIDYDLAVNLSYALAIGSAAIFGRSFVSTRTIFPRTDRIILAMLALFVTANVALIVAPELLEAVGLYDACDAIVTALLLLPLAACALVAACRGEREAALYGLAVAGVLIGNVIGAAENNDLIVDNPFTVLAPTLGFAWEALLLSFALAERLRTYERDVLLDPLTRLVNRRGLERRLANERDHAVRTGAPLSVLVVDIDRFKAYNDRFGHLAGDAALQRVAAALGSALRAIDCAARFGGEEFVALLPGTNLAGAAALADRVRAAIRAEAIAHPDGIDDILTVSVGAAEAHDRESIETLLTRADEALYRAKRSGRDRVAS